MEGVTVPEAADVYADLKAKIADFAAIAKECPENLQVKCFELLLGRYLDGRPPAAGGPKSAVGSDPAPEPGPTHAPPSLPKSQEDIARSDVHVRALKFLDRYGLTLDDVNEVLYKEGDQFLPLYEDLKTTKASECQLRIALMLAFRSALGTGEFVFNGETVRAECQTRKCYDQPNFATTFKRNAELFDGLTKYESSAPVVRLSEDGRKALAALIKELR